MGCASAVRLMLQSCMLGHRHRARRTGDGYREGLRAAEGISAGPAFVLKVRDLDENDLAGIAGLARQPQARRRAVSRAQGVCRRTGTILAVVRGVEQGLDVEGLDDHRVQAAGLVKNCRSTGLAPGGSAGAVILDLEHALPKVDGRSVAVAVGIRHRLHEVERVRNITLTGVHNQDLSVVMIRDVIVPDVRALRLREGHMTEGRGIGIRIHADREVHLFTNSPFDDVAALVQQNLAALAVRRFWIHGVQPGAHASSRQFNRVTNATSAVRPEVRISKVVAEICRGATDAVAFNRNRTRIVHRRLVDNQRTHFRARAQTYCRAVVLNGKDAFAQIERSGNHIPVSVDHRGFQQNCSTHRVKPRSIVGVGGVGVPDVFILHEGDNASIRIDHDSKVYEIAAVDLADDVVPVHSQQDRGALTVTVGLCLGIRSIQGVKPGSNRTSYLCLQLQRIIYIAGTVRTITTCIIKISGEIGGQDMNSVTTVTTAHYSIRKSDLKLIRNASRNRAIIILTNCNIVCPRSRKRV